MFRYLYTLALPVLLLGCQTHNPYQTESVPLTQIISHPKHLPTDNKASKTPYDYHYWCWATNPQTIVVEQQSESAQSILAEQLEQYGLRPADSIEQCELQVQLNSQHSSHRVLYDYHPSAYYGYGHPFHDRHRHSGFGMSFPIYPYSSIDYSLQLQLSFTDAATQHLIWRSVNTVNSNQYGQASEQALRKAFNTMLNNFF